MAVIRAGWRRPFPYSQRHSKRRGIISGGPLGARGTLKEPPRSLAVERRADARRCPPSSYCDWRCAAACLIRWSASWLKVMVIDLISAPQRTALLDVLSGSMPIRR